MRSRERSGKPQNAPGRANVLCRGYPSDINDEEWEFCAPYLTLMDPEAPQRRHSFRALFNALLYIAKTGVQWRYLPENFPPYHAVYQQSQR